MLILLTRKPIIFEKDSQIVVTLINITVVHLLVTECATAVHCSQTIK